MFDQSANLGLPYLAAGQAQKHVTMNEALARLDALAQIALGGIGAETPPASAAEGTAYALGPAPTGAWDGHGGEVALALNGGWDFAAPRPGWVARDLSTGALVTYDGTGWIPVYTAATALGPVGLDAGRPTGALVETGRAGRGGFTRLADGTQTAWALVDVDVASTAVQTFALPVPFDGGHVVAVAASHAAAGANAALAPGNLRLLGADAGGAFLALASAGTAQAPGTDAERLVLTLTGRWA